ncbi:serine/arginine-rich splicing factor 11 isoform X1 [Anarrhichthys ocellatus]|uniref:serine/arginine-rich splicing factor 11 isoform X1 n=3 Tax=Anarrhichthys ocellatus TaxID=433405 RepID=UPI0012EE1959|nr:serine/arginine-rich splicing factor 11 isoform X1 [Anarrhichthys ocellatus]
MNSNTHVIQVTNVSPSTTSEHMRTLFGFLGNIEELKLFPPDDSPLPVTSRVCFVKFLESESVGVSQHLTNTVFVDRALIVVPFAEGVIPDESKAMSLLAPANAVAGMMPGGGLLPTPNPLASMGGTPFGGLGGPSMEQMAAMGMQGPNMNPQALSADFLKLMQSMDPKLNPLAAGLNLNPGLKNDASNKEIEEAMKRVREAQSLISAAIEPGNKKDDKRKHSRSRSRRRRSRSRSRHRRSKSRSRRRSHSRSRRKSKSPRRRRTHSRERNRHSRSRDRRKEEKAKKRSKTPPKSYSSARRSRSISRRHRRSRSASRSPKRRLSRSPSLRRHKKEKKKEKEREKERDRDRREDRDRSRDERERSASKKKKSKDKERDRERKSDSEKGDVKVTRDYDEEEQGYDSEKEREEDDDERKSDSDSASSPKGQEEMEMERSEGHIPKKSKVNGDDHHQEDMEMSD